MRTASRRLARSRRDDPGRTDGTTQERAAGRRRDGQRQRLGHHAPRRGAARRVRHRLRGARACPRTGCPTTCSSTPRTPRPRGLRCIIAGAGGAAHLPGMLAAKTTVPVLGVPVPSKYLRGEDSLLLDRPDAEGHSGRHVRDRRSRRRQRGAVRRRDDRRHRPRASRKKLAAFRVKQTRRRTRDARAAEAEPVADRDDRSRPAPGSGSWAAASSAGCSAWPRRAWATRSSVLDPGAASPAGSVADRHIRADYLDPAGLAELARAAPPRRRPNSRTFPPRRSISSRARARVTPAAASVAIAQDRIREKTFLARPRLRGRAVRRAAHATPMRSAVDAALAPGHRQERALRLRRQGADPRRARATTLPPRSARWAARRACSSSCVRSPAKSRSSSRATSAARRATWPVAENRHRDGILDVSIVPARVSAGARDAGARDRHAPSRTKLDYRGVLCVEMFVTARRRCCSSTRSRRARTTAATTRSTPA